MNQPARSYEIGMMRAARTPGDLANTVPENYCCPWCHYFTLEHESNRWYEIRFGEVTRFVCQSCMIEVLAYCNMDDDDIYKAHGGSVEAVAKLEGLSGVEFRRLLIADQLEQLESLTVGTRDYKMCIGLREPLTELLARLEARADQVNKNE